ERVLYPPEMAAGHREVGAAERSGGPDGAGAGGRRLDQAGGRLEHERRARALRQFLWEVVEQALRPSRAAGQLIALACQRAWFDRHGRLTGRCGWRSRNTTGTPPPR